MTLSDLKQMENFTEIVPPEDPDREISVPYCCDLLSVAMHGAPEDSAWCTVMNNINTLAVSSLADTACVILCDGIAATPEVRQKALQQEICLFETSLNSFEAALEVYKRIHELSI